MQKRAHIFVSGRVQGVFFRAETKRTAQIYNLSGWVRNLRDGRVEAVFEGDEQNIEHMIAWCHEGPPFAVVEHLETSEEPVSGEFEVFSIRY
jgi:acylphosphatase